jgi:hypothetical protein
MATGTRLQIEFEYNGLMFPLDMPAQEQIEGAWHRALAHFDIRPEDAGNLGLFLDGNPVERAQSFEQAGVPSGATLRIQPIVQRNG